jgi:hypothetical protein
MYRYDAKTIYRYATYYWHEIISISLEKNKAPERRNLMVCNTGEVSFYHLSLYSKTSSFDINF